MSTSKVLGADDDDDGGGRGGVGPPEAPPSIVEDACNVGVDGLRLGLLS
jgi:hypothetical protein